jgi:hypothetical protein
MLQPHGHLPPPIRVPWLAVLATVVLQQGLAFLWYAGLFGGIWLAAQDFGFDYQSEHEGAVLAPTMMAIGNAAGAIFLAVLLQRVHWPVAFGPLRRGLFWGLLVWLCVALPLDAMRNLFAMRDPLVLLIDAGQSLVSWLIAGAVIGGWPKRRTQEHGAGAPPAG